MRGAFACPFAATNLITTEGLSAVNKTIMAIGVSVSAAVLLLAGCSSGDRAGDPTTSVSRSVQPPAPAQAAAHNHADVTFAQQMIPHHQQAVTMAAMAAQHAANAQVKDLAARIEKAQGPEIQQMTTWLEQWGASGSMPSQMNHGGMASSMPGMSGGSMSGMMSDADMQKLQQAGGAAFDTMFLQMMVTHHQGAVEMAKTELASGANADAKALAQRITDTQTAEITEMQQLLATL